MTPRVSPSYGSCGCGRSPTGDCCGWHGLTEEVYQEKLKEYKLKNTKDNANVYLWLENSDIRDGSK